MCREFDFAGQQQVALKLHKLAGAKDEYYVWWAIVAITLQAKAAAKGKVSALPTDKLLQLAEVMVAKQAQKGGIRSYEQLMLYLDILQVCSLQAYAHKCAHQLTRHLQTAVLTIWTVCTTHSLMNQCAYARKNIASTLCLLTGNKVSEYLMQLHPSGRLEIALRKSVNTSMCHDWTPTADSIVTYEGCCRLKASRSRLWRLWRARWGMSFPWQLRGAA